MKEYPTGWFAVLDAKELKNKLLSVQLFGIDIVFWRKNNLEPVAMLDKCPHRSAKLSLGRKTNDCIECPFHGFQFSFDGFCKYAPEFNSALPSLKIKTFYCREFKSFIWIWTGDDEPMENIPWLNELTDNFIYSQLKSKWNADMTRCVENQLDFTHLPFVHKSTIGKGFKWNQKRVIKNSTKKIEIFLNSEKLEQPANIEFFYPNIWINRITPKFILLLAFVPVEVGKTKLYLRSYQSYIKMPFLKNIFSFIVDLLNYFILKQDQSVVLSQGKSPSTKNNYEVLMENDIAIRYFRKFWSKELK